MGRKGKRTQSLALIADIQLKSLGATLVEARRSPDTSMPNLSISEIS